MARSRTTIATVVALATLAIALIVLATLQYRWIGRLAEADGKRMRTSMEFAANHFRDEVDRELTRTFIAFQGPMPGASAEELLARYDRWAATTRDPHLIAAIFFVPAGSTQLHRLDIEGRRFEPVAWPQSLERVRARLASMQSFQPHAIPPILPESLTLVAPCGGMGMFMHGGPPPGGRGFRGGLGPGGPGNPFMPPQVAGGTSCPAFTIVQLDRDHMTRVLLPELTRRYFDTDSGSDYEIAIVDEARNVFFRSPGWPRGDDFRADLTMPLFTILHLANGAPPPFPPRAYWNLLVRHREGSLADTIEATRLKNLAVALGVLVLLGGSAAALLVLLRRAERLQLQQLEFVAGITHELNTPLAALTSAGQNLADGIVSDREQVSKYGGIVVKEARRLGDMVAEVLDYAGMQSGRRTLRMDDLDITAIVTDAIEQCRWMAEGAGIRIEKAVAPDAPHATGDAAALTRAVQNLVANAIRHGGDAGWVRVLAAADAASIAITVEDGGRGIPSRELPHLFEPFFRGSSAAAVRGSGLGLTIVDQIARAHGGSVSVDRHRRSGAAFTIRLPRARQTAPAGAIADQHA